MLAICVEVCKSLTIPITVLQSSIRGSLVLSMLQQMLLDERIEEIRSSIVRCLAILVCFIEDNDKFQQVRYRLELVGFLAFHWLSYMHMYSRTAFCHCLTLRIFSETWRPSK